MNQVYGTLVTKLNSSEEEKELAWTRIAGVLHYSKSKLIYSYYIKKPYSL